MNVVVTGVGGPAGGSLVRQLAARSTDSLSIIGVDMAEVEVDGLTLFERVPAAADPGYGPA